MRATDPEISDLIVAYDPETLERRPVHRDEVVLRFRELGNRRAARIVASIPASGGVLDSGAVDELLIRVHAELQRLHEEFQHGRRVKRWLDPLLAALRREGAPRPLRVVDIGCGLGFVVRWLAAFGQLGDDVELVGVDYNQALVRGARRLAERENLDCHFRVANAFTLAEPATVFISTGVIHHFQGADLDEFFAQQDDAWGFAHWDIAQTWAAGMGAWIFHEARMREPLSKHDGVLSALRAHTDDILLDAARRSAPGMSSAVFESPNPVIPILKVLRPVVGFRPDLRPALFEELGTSTTRLDGLL